VGDDIIAHQQPMRIEVEPIIGVGKILPMFAGFFRLRGEGWSFGQKQNDRVHLTQHQARGAGRRRHIDPSHRIGIDSVKLRKGWKHHAACVTDARADSLAFEILRRLDVVFLQRSEGIERFVGMTPATLTSAPLERARMSVGVSENAKSTAPAAYEEMVVADPSPLTIVTSKPASFQKPLSRAAKNGACLP